MLRHFTYFLLICWLSLFAVSIPYAAAQEQILPCATDQVTAKKLVTDSTYRAFIERVKPQTNKAIADTTTIITIPVVFVVYHLGEPIGAGSNVSEADLQNQIGLMNKMFAGTRPTYGGVDTRIRFTLARRSASCAPFDGIARVDARSVPMYESSGLTTIDWQMTNKLRELIPEFRNSVAERFVVVRVVYQPGVSIAWASYGGDIVIGAQKMSYADPYNSILAHEMGHVLFLQHTFNRYGYNSSTGIYSCPPNADPENDGDQVADTDPHKIWEPANSCSSSSELEINSCTGQPFGLIGRNFMSYGCNPMTFTAGQRFRMRSYLAEGLRGLATSVYGTAPDPGQQLVALACSMSIVSATTNVGEGITEVQFQDIRKTSNASTAISGHYQDYTCQERTTVTAGQSYSLDIKGYGAYQRAYIDYNNDGVFQETAELVWTSAPPIGLITIPTTTVTDRYLRMRIVVDNGSSPPTACYLPGSQYGSGEVEDYAVRVLPADTPPTVALGPLASVYLCRSQQLAVPIVMQGTFPADNIFRVQLSDASGNFDNAVLIGSGTRSPISVTLPANSALSEDYRLRVLASNPALTSESSPVLAIENPAMVSIVPGSATLTAGQSTSLTIALTGRLPIAFTIYQNNYGLWDFSGLQQRTYVHQFTSSGPAVYSISNVRNGCGVGIGSGSFTVITPCPTPGSLTETEQTTYGFRANWNSTVGQTYIVQLKEAGTTSWSQVQNQSNWFISDLTFNKTYVWRVKTVCLNGESDWSAERTVTMSCAMPFILREVLGLRAATLRWWYMGAGTTYSIQWRPTGSTDWTTVAAPQGSVYELTNLTEGNSYEWRIRSNCTDGTSSTYSPIKTFTTQCGTPTIDGWSLSSTALTFYWTGVAGSRYQVQYRPVSTGAGWILSDSATALRSATVRNLQTNTPYEFQVRAVCSVTANSAFSSSLNVTPICPQPSFLQLSTISFTGARFTWQTELNQQVDLRWRAVGTATWTDVLALTTTSYQFSNLTTGTTYEVQLRGVCSGTTVTAYTSSLTFTPACPVPVGSNMWVLSRGPSSVEVVYAIELGVAYSLQWRALGTTTWQSSATTVATYTSTGYRSVISNLSSNTTYEWHVLSFCSGGLTGTSGIGQFQTGCYVPYSTGISVSSTSTWVYVSGTASPIQIRWRPVGTTTWTESSTITSTSYQITGLTVDVPYEWQVRAICSPAESSAYSPSSQFTTQCNAPPALSLYTSNVAPRSAVLNWSGSNGSPIELRWRALGNPDWTSVASLTTTFYSLTGLTTGTTYEWQARSVCSGTVVSSYVAGPGFTLTCPLATNLAEEFVSPGAAQLRWTAGGGQLYTVQWRIQGETTWPGSATYVPSHSGLLTSFLITGLTGGATYEWRVLTNCEATPTASASRTFVTECRAPLAQSAYNVSSRRATVYWRAYSGILGIAYRVRWRAVGTTTWAESATTITTSMPLTGLTYATTYEWQVQSICDGTPTGYSANGTNFTPTCPTPSLYSVSASDAWVRLNWYYITGELSSVQYRIRGSSNWTTFSGLTTGNYSLTGLIPSTVYEWRVSFNCQDSQTNTTSIGSFSTLASCDPYEPNNTPQTATVIPANATSYSTGAICLSMPTDNDWFRWEINGAVYYILVYPFAYETAGSYSLTMSYVNNVLKVNTQPVAGTPWWDRNLNTDTYLKLYAADGITLLAENDDSYHSVYSEISYTLPANCTAMATVKAGQWTDPTVWTCGRVPTSVDAVQVLHSVSVPLNQTGRAGRMTYGAGGSVTFETGARLMLGL